MIEEIRTGHQTLESDIGWLVLSDALACLRTVRNFLTSEDPARPAGKKKGRR